MYQSTWYRQQKVIISNDIYCCDTFPRAMSANINSALVGPESNLQSWTALGDGSHCDQACKVVSSIYYTQIHNLYFKKLQVNIKILCILSLFYEREWRYFKLFFIIYNIYKLDETDTKFMERLLQKDCGICPKCYRTYVDRMYRWQVILELISFYTLMIFLYMPLIVLILLPAIFNGGLQTMEDIKNPKNNYLN